MNEDRQKYVQYRNDYTLAEARFIPREMKDEMSLLSDLVLTRHNSDMFPKPLKLLRKSSNEVFD